MTTMTFSKAISVAALSFAALCSFPSAQAAVYVGEWDPAFGPALPDLGFAGRAKFFIPDACLAGPANPGTFISDGAACSGGGMYLIEAAVDLYNVSNPLVILETLTYAPPVAVTDPVFGMFVEFNAITGQNEVTGVSTDFIGPQTSTLLIAEFNSFWLVFGPTPVIEVGGPVDVQALLGPGTDQRYIEASLFTAYCPECGPNPGSRSNPATVNFSRVPEPASVVLVMAGLFAGALARRSRRA